MKFRHKLLLLPALAAAFLVAMLAVSAVLARRSEALLERIEQGHAPAVALSRDLEVALATLQRTLQDAVAAEDEEGLNDADGAAARFVARLDEARLNPVFPEERREALRRQFRDYAEYARATSASLLRQDAAALDALPEMARRYNAMRQSLEASTRKEQGAQAEAFAAARALHGRSQRVLWTLGLACVALLAGLSLWLAAQVSRPLAQLTEVAARIASERDLTVEVPRGSSDEVGQLAASFRAMVQQLRTMASTLQQEAEALAGVIHALSGVAHRQGETLQRQAQSITEAAITMEEIRQTSSLAASKAEGVLAVATEAEQVGQEGQEALSRSVSVLQALQEEVGSLTGSISALTGKTVRAGDIVLRVKDLADQSNMLALNAAIEATRAGDGGRSFAIVAREMRSLANQSLQSTEHIRAILTDIDTAVGAAVRTAEGGRERMTEGILEVRLLGERMHALIEVVQQSTRAAQEIVASVSQQDSGIAQMSTAITEQARMMEALLQATRESEQTVARLGSTFERLKTVVGGFRV